MRITLSVLLATLTIYCSSSVLSLPPSLIATAASLGQQLARPTRDSHGDAAVGDAAATDHLLSQLSGVIADSPSHSWQVLRSKKEARFLLDGDDIARLPSSPELNNNVGNKMTHSIEVSGSKSAAAATKDAREHYRGSGSGISNRKLPAGYDLKALLASATSRLELQRAAAQKANKQQQPHSASWRQRMQATDVAPHIRAMQMKEFFTPLKYWARHCQPPDRSCPQEYYRVLLAERSRAAAAAAKQMDDFTASAGDHATKAAADDDDDVNMSADAFAFGGIGGGGNPLANFNDDAVIDNVYNDADAVADMASADGGDDDNNDDFDDNEDNNAGNDILMLLSGEQDVMKFLSWAMQQLYPYQHFANLKDNSGDGGDGGAVYYHPSMFNWKKLNLSGHVEPPLVVDEPHYVIVRREPLEDDLQPDPQYKDDPFIPPRGRKHNLPDLDALLNRYETFVPNRGKRDKIKDIFKYDDLFFPNRGKKLKPPKAATLALDGQWQRSPGDDEANEVAGRASENEDNAGNSEESVRLLDNQVDGNDDSNLTAPPVRDAIRRMQCGRKRHLQPHELGLAGSGRDTGADDGETIRILFDKSSDDNGNNYSDTIDNNLAAVVDDNGDGHGDGEGTAAAAAIVNWLQSNTAITRDLFNENDQSVKSLVPQIDARDTLAAAMDERPATFAAQQPLVRGAFTDPRMRRVARTFADATRPAANHLRSMSSMTRQPQRTIRLHLHYDQQERATEKQQQPTKTALRLFGRHLRHEQLQNQRRQKKQAQRRAAWQLSLLPTPARASSNDFDLLFARHLQQSNRPSMIVQHPSLTWWQPKQLQLQQHLVGPVDDGVAARRSSSPENTETDRIDFSI